MHTTYGLGKVDRLFRTEFYFWPQTIERWKKKGLPENYNEINLFGYDENPYADPLVNLGWVDPPFCPAYQNKIIQEDMNYKVVQDTTGTIKKILKNNEIYCLWPDFEPEYDKREHAWTNLKGLGDVLLLNCGQCDGPSDMRHDRCKTCGCSNYYCH